MAKLEEIVYDVREALKEYADDSELDNRYIVYLYNIKRAKYLRQQLNNYQQKTDISIQQTFCLSMELVSGDECNGDCPKILKSTQPIPIPLELHSRVAITSVKPTGRTDIPFNFTTKERIPFLEGSLFSRGIYAFLDVDNHIYATSLSNAYKLLSCVTVTGVFENPLDLKDYKNCCDCNQESEDICFDELNSEYPLQPHFIDLIKNEIVQELAGLKQIPEDRENNSTDL